MVVYVSLYLFSTFAYKSIYYILLVLHFFPGEWHEKVQLQSTNRNDSGKFVTGQFF